MNRHIDLSSGISLNQQVDTLKFGFISYFPELFTLSETNIIEATHLVRKTLKFYRATLKLLKDCSTEKSYKRANIFLRDIGKEFSELRDSHVRSQLIEEFRFDIDSIPDQSYWNSLVLLNQSEIEQWESVVTVQSNRFSTVTTSIETSADISLFYDQLKPTINCIFTGFRHSVSRSKQAFLIAKNSHQYSDFHEWRKRLKDVQNQLKLLLEKETSLEHKFLINTDTLCKSLGRFNDLAMLIDWIEKKKDNIENKTTSDKFSRYLRKRTRNLHQKLLTSGHEFYNKSESSIHHFLTSFLIE